MEGLVGWDRYWVAQVGGKRIGGKRDNTTSHVVSDSVFMAEMDRRRHVEGQCYPRHLFGGSSTLR